MRDFCTHFTALVGAEAGVTPGSLASPARPLFVMPSVGTVIFRKRRKCLRCIEALPNRAHATSLEYKEGQSSWIMLRVALLHHRQRKQVVGGKGSPRSRPSQYLCIAVVLIYSPACRILIPQAGIQSEERVAVGPIVAGSRAHSISQSIIRKRITHASVSECILCWSSPQSMRGPESSMKRCTPPTSPLACTSRRKVPFPYLASIWIPSHLHYPP